MINLKSNYISDSATLDSTLREDIQHQKNHYYFLVDEWNKDSLNLLEKFKVLDSNPEGNYLNIISIWNIPNAIQIIRGVINEDRGWSNFLMNHPLVPCLIIINGNSIKVMDYANQFYKELEIN